ncbi:MAG: hypothetical protein WAT79_02550 [Saprospiraceae bacterium]
MYKILSLLLSSFLFFSPAIGQKVLTEGTVKMEISDVKSDDPQIAMQMEMMKGSTMDLFFKGDEHITHMNMMGGLMVMKTQVMQAANKMNLFMDMMGQKMWIESALDEVQTPEQKEIAEKVNIVYDKKDTKVIEGYNCYKMTLSSPDDAEGMNVQAYVTEEIKANARIIRGFESVEYVGFPLEFTVGNGMFTMTMTTKAISDKVDSEKMKIETEGYKKMTMEEFQSSFGNMGF